MKYYIAFFAIAFVATATAFGLVLVEVRSQQQLAIAYITEAKDVHEEWVEQLIECRVACNELAELVGTVKYHEEWVRRYAVVLEVLEQ